MLANVLKGGVPKWLRERSAKPRCSGSNPLAASNFQFNPIRPAKSRFIADVLLPSRPLSGSEQAIKLSFGVQPLRIIIAADRFSIDKNLRHAPSLRQFFHLGSTRRIIGHVDLVKLYLLRAQ
jgi:hypothetical protein